MGTGYSAGKLGFAKITGIGVPQRNLKLEVLCNSMAVMGVLSGLRFDKISIAGYLLVINVDSGLWWMQ